MIKIFQKRSRTFKIVVAIVSIVVFLSSIQSLHEKNLPKCSDKQTVDLVLQTSYETIYNRLEEHFVPKFARSKLSPKELQATLDGVKNMIYEQVPVLDTSKYFFQLDGIRTIERNNTTKAYTCLGVFKIIDLKTQTILNENNMTYTVGLTDDKKSVYITIHDE